jgi:hypothetical protein
MGAADRLPTVCPVVSVVALGLLGDGGHQRATAPPGTIVVVEAGCGLGEAYGRGLVGVPWAPAAGLTRPAHPTQQGPGMQGATAMPTVVVVCSAFSLPK